MNKLFLQRVRIYSLPGTKIGALLERAWYAIHWKTEMENLNELIAEHGIDILGEKDIKQLKLKRDFSHYVGDILASITNRIQPRSFEELVKFGFNADFSD